MQVCEGLLVVLNCRMGLGGGLGPGSTLEDFLTVMGNLDWTPELARSLENTILESQIVSFCDAETVSAITKGWVGI